MAGYTISEPPINGDLSQVKAYLMEQHTQLGNILLSLDSENMTDEFVSEISNIKTQLASIQSQIAELQKR